MKIYGDLHTHTVYSDGRSTVDDNVAAAVGAGLRQVAITDHGHGKLKQGMKRKDYSIIQAQVKKAAEEHKIEVLFGAEANITGADGEIDITNDERGEFDILLCGIHRGVKAHNIKSFFTFFLPNWFWSFCHWTPKGRVRKNTRAVINAVEKNNIDILVHPGRYFRVNVVDIAKVCIARGTVMELNSKRISFRPIDFERMAAMGAKFVVGSDAHTAVNVGKMGRVEEFLKLCDYPADTVVNLDKPFARPKAQIMRDIIEEENGRTD
jgi:putative hydrolase